MWQIIASFLSPSDLSSIMLIHSTLYETLRHHDPLWMHLKKDRYFVEPQSNYRKVFLEKCQKLHCEMVSNSNNEMKSMRKDIKKAIGNHREISLPFVPFSQIPNVDLSTFKSKRNDRENFLCVTLLGTCESAIGMNHILHAIFNNALLEDPCEYFKTEYYDTIQINKDTSMLVIKPFTGKSNAGDVHRAALSSDLIIVYTDTFNLSQVDRFLHYGRWKPLAIVGLGLPNRMNPYQASLKRKNWYTYEQLEDVARLAHAFTYFEMTEYSLEGCMQFKQFLVNIANHAAEVKSNLPKKGCTLC